MHLTINSHFLKNCVWFLCSISAYWISYAFWSPQCGSRTDFTLWCSGVHCRRRHDLHAILGMLRSRIPLHFSGYHHVNKANFMYSPSDDAKSSSARGRYGVHKKCEPPQGQICQVAASYNRLFGYLKPQSNVSMFLLIISYPSGTPVYPSFSIWLLYVTRVTWYE